MFAYNPRTENRAGEIYGRNAILSAQMLANAQERASQLQAQSMLDSANRRHQAIVDGAGLVGDVGRAVVGFATGGPAGAAMAAGGGGGGGDDGLLGSIISSFANKKALDAKDKAYTSFFSKHGKDLGFDPGYLDELRSMSRDDRLMAFDLMTSQPGQRLGSMAYMNQQANLFSGGRGSGTGGGMGSGTAAPQESVTF